MVRRIAGRKGAHLPRTPAARIVVDGAASLIAEALLTAAMELALATIVLRARGRDFGLSAPERAFTLTVRDR